MHIISPESLCSNVFIIYTYILAKKIYEDAMKDGSVERNVIKCLIIGPAGVGKTAIKHLLINKEPPKKRESTGVMENPIRAVSLSRAMGSDCDWSVMNDDEEFMMRIADHLKTNYISSALKTESKPSSKLNSAVADNQPSLSKQRFEYEDVGTADHLKDYQSSLRLKDNIPVSGSTPDRTSTTESKLHLSKDLYGGVSTLKESEILSRDSPISFTSQSGIIHDYVDIQLPKTTEPVQNSEFKDIENSIPSLMQTKIVEESKENPSSSHISDQANTSNPIHQKFIDAITNAPGISTNHIFM